MMQRLLTLAFLVLAAGALTAQDIIWQEDFSKGMAGWRVNPISCGGNANTYGNNSGPDFGIWTLTAGTLNNVALDYTGLAIEWSFLNDTEYQFTLTNDDNTVYSTVYGTYSLSGDTLVSSLNASAELANGLVFAETTVGGIVEWATITELPNAATLTFVDAHTGRGEPTVIYSNGGNTLTYTQITDSGDVYVFTYTKRSECGMVWTWSPNGNMGNGVFGFEAPGAIFVASETRTNGTMVMNNIFQMFRGDAGLIPAPNPPPYPQYVAELISPPIDISAADRALSISLTQRLAYLNTPTDAPNGLKTSFAVSTDDGATWSPATDFNPNFATNTFRNNRQTIPILNNYTNGADEIRVKITFATDYYFWGIDDISIQERIGYDIQANANFFAIPDNVNTPYSQLQPQYFMSDIQNNGGLVAENVQLNLQIVNVTDGGTVVYDQTKNYGTIAVDSIAENDFIDITMPLDLAPDESSVGFYEGTYALSQDSVDVNPANDSLFFSFSVTDTLFAKETGRTRGIFLTNDRSWFIGNSYYVPNGENWYARYISFMVDNASDAVTTGDGRVTTLLYESDGDVDGNGRIGPDEYGNGPIAFNEYVFDGSEDEVLVTVPVSIDEEGILMTSGKYYFAVIQFSSTSATDQLAISASEAYNYNANNFITDSIGVEQYSDIVELVTESPNFFSGGFGGTVVPIVRLSIGDNPFLDQPAITAIETVLPSEYGVSVFPVPAKDNFNMKVDFPKQVDVLVRLYDQTGRIILTQEFDKLQNGSFNYDVRTLASGMYFLQLDTDAGTRIEKIVVQH
jgi:hypothetical protein